MRRKIKKYISMGMTAVMLLGAVPMQTVLGADSSDSGYILEAEGGNDVSARASVGGDDVPEKSDDADAEKIEVLDDVKAGAESEDVTNSFTDDNFRKAVRDELKLEENAPITKDACEKLWRLNVNEKEIENLAGIEHFTNLTSLDCSGNKLTSLDVSSCAKLSSLYCNDNQLESLKVSDCAGLKYLKCNNNQLKALEISTCTDLTTLNCDNNIISDLIINGNINLENLYCEGNQLESLDVNGCINLVYLSCGNNQLKTLNVDNLVNLKTLYCGDNQLIKLDISDCTDLEMLSCSGNQLTMLEVSGFESLKDLSCYNNQLAGLDISNCTNLSSLFIFGNPLTTLNAGNCINLISLSSNYGQLEKLDVSGCSGITSLYCDDNQLIELNVSGCTSLSNLSCDGNQLTALDVSTCTALESLSCKKNNMKSIDDVTGRPAELSDFQFEPQNHASETTPDPVPSQIPPEPSIPVVNPDPTPDITPDPTPLPTPNPAAQNFKETCFVKEIVDKEKTFEIPSAGRARLTFEECVNPESYRLEISGCRVSDFRLTNEKEKASTNWFVVSSGTLKVNLSSNQPVNDEAVAYVEYEAGGSYVGEVESNDSYETANKIAVNTDYWAAGGDDWDYFYFEVDGPSKVEFPETFRTYWNDGRELLLYRADEKNRKELYSQAFGDREESFLPSMRLTKGKYYLAFHPWYYYTYKMRINLTQESAESYEQESNDLQSKANRKEVNKPYTGNINVRNLDGRRNFDIDWYQFDIPNKSYLAAELKVPSEASGKVKASLKNAAKDDILRITSTDNPYLKSEETLVEPGTYYICMERGSEYEGYDRNAYWDYTICLNQRDYIELNSISLPSSETMAVRQSKFLTPTFIPANATEQTLLWESSNEKVVTVNEEGAVSTKAEGTATITAKAKHDPSIQAQCQIRVTKTGVPPATVTPPVKPDNSPTPAPGGEPGNTPTPGGTDDPGAAKQVKLNKSSLSLKAGNTSRLKLNNAEGKVTWRSSSPSTVSVSSSGLVKGKKLGKATVRAYYNGRVYSCRVTVNSLFKKAVWYGYSNGGYYFWVRSISGKTMKVSIHMPNMTIKNKRATINANGKTATLKFKCGKRKTHSLTIRASGGSIVIQEKSSCTKKIMTIKSRERKKTIKHTFRPAGWVWWRY